MLVNIFTFVIGSIVGSFLNVCISRLPNDESIISPASHCPHCKAKINWHDNIPLISYLLLRGKCRSCEGTISIRYPIVELLTGLFFLLTSFGVGTFLRLEYYFNLIFICGMIVAFFSDLETQIIPDQVIYLTIPASLIYNLLTGNIFGAIYGALLGFSILYLVQKAGTFVFKKDALGGGDIKLAALFGAHLLWQGMLLSLFLGYLIGSIQALILLALKIKKLDDYIPFGPALCSGALIVLFFGNKLISMYFNLMIYGTL